MQTEITELTETYFPLLIHYADRVEQCVVKSVEELRAGCSFKVLETNYGDEGDA